jgi:hypothetical protein
VSVEYIKQPWPWQCPGFFSYIYSTPADVSMLVFFKVLPLPNHNNPGVSQINNLSWDLTETEWHQTNQHRWKVRSWLATVHYGSCKA